MLNGEDIRLGIYIHGGSVAKLCLTHVTPWTVARQATLSMGILQARILEWVPFPSPGDLPDPGIEPKSPALQADSLPTELKRNSLFVSIILFYVRNWQHFPFWYNCDLLYMEICYCTKCGLSVDQQFQQPLELLRNNTYWTRICIFDKTQMIHIHIQTSEALFYNSPHFQIALSRKEYTIIMKIIMTILTA